MLETLAASPVSLYTTAKEEQMLTLNRARTVLLFSACVLTIITFYLTLVPTPVQAQAVNATVLGTIDDSSGAVVGGANITITEESTALTRTTATNSSGNFVFPNLPPGTYKVSAEAKGFKKETRASL